VPATTDHDGRISCERQAQVCRIVAQGRFEAARCGEGDHEASGPFVSRTDVLVGRQPVFDRDLQVVGYELVLDAAPDDALGLSDQGDKHGKQAEGEFLLTAAVVFGSLVLGIDRFVGDKMMFCDAGTDLLLGVSSPLVPPDRTVLEVPTGAVFGTETASAVGPACHRLAREGYTLALDDFGWFEGADEMLPLFGYVKVDRRRLDAAAIAAVVEGCRPFGTRIVAHPVDTFADLAECVDLGVDLCQGHLLLRPEPVEGRTLEPGQLGMLRLAARLLDPDAGIPEIDDIVRADPTLSLQLLRMAAIGPPGRLGRTVGSVREALVLVGWRRLQSWMSLLLFSGGGVLPTEVLTATLARARMCELLADHVPGTRPETAFTAGMLSMLEVLLGVPLADVVADLPLTDEVRHAVVDHRGPLGLLLADVIDFQSATLGGARRSGLRYGTVQMACFDALAWAIEVATGFDAGSLT